MSVTMHQLSFAVTQYWLACNAFDKGKNWEAQGGMFCDSKISSGWNLDLKILTEGSNDFGPEICAFFSPLKFISVKNLCFRIMFWQMFLLLDVSKTSEGLLCLWRGERSGSRTAFTLNWQMACKKNEKKEVRKKNFCCPSYRSYPTVVPTEKVRM